MSVLGVVLGLVGCGSSSTDESDNGVATSGSGGSSAGAPVGGTAGSSGSSPGNSGHGGAVVGAGGSGPGAGGSIGAAGGGGGPIMGGPGCGFATAAFCDMFDAPSSPKGRAGELDSKRWSGGRMQPQLPTGNGQLFAIRKATIPACRPDLPAQVLPDDDALICDANPDIDSKHLLVAVGAQNYGQNSYRIRQPFDFAGRTGKIAFDAEGYLINPLLGWISVAVTEDPMSVPGFAVGPKGTTNDDGTVIPRSGFNVEFQDAGAGIATTPVVGIRMINIFQDYKDTVNTPANRIVVATKQGRLNHFEVEVSQTKIDVYATPFSADGKTFEPRKLLYSTAVNLAFSRGYVTISVHNHATIKYSPDHNNPIDAWVARWDNVGFDGPVITNFREYEAPDALVPGVGVMNVAYHVPDAAGASTLKLPFRAVDIAGIAGARLAFSSWYLDDYMNGWSKYTVRFRLNSHAWHDRVLNAGEIGVLTSGNNQGAIAQIVDVDPSELAAGDNSLELVTQNVPQNYPPAVLNVDLVLSTK
jgi:hypothetical protein